MVHAVRHLEGDSVGCAGDFQIAGTGDAPGETLPVDGKRDGVAVGAGYQRRDAGQAMQALRGIILSDWPRAVSS